MLNIKQENGKNKHLAQKLDQIIECMSVDLVKVELCL